MVKIIDCTMQDFKKKIKNKKIIVFGAGRQAVKYTSFWELGEQIICVVDNDPSKQGKKLCINNHPVDIVSPRYLRDPKISNTPILITSFFGFFAIIQQLDAISNLDKAECYICSLMQEKCERQNIVFPSGKQLIPKIIHYCWFGGHEIPDHLKRYMESWNRICPDYEIMRWDESNYDVSKNRYMREAYEQKKWGFVPDYARLDIVYQQGGIYLDTDVEMIKNFDDLLCASSFMGFGDSNSVYLGLGFGAEKGNELILRMREDYNDKVFIQPNGMLNMCTCNEYQDPIILQYGFKLDNSLQIINNNILYPMEVFNPEGKIGYHKCYSVNTHSVHRSNMSYVSEEEKGIYYDGIQKIRDRIENV